MVQRRAESGIEWLEYPLLAGLKHGSMLRRGGVSVGSRDSLNLAFDGDVEEHVQENLVRVQKVLGLDSLHYSSKQMHGSDLIEVHKDSPQVLPPCDALVTREPGVALMIRHADCQGAILYDPLKRVLAVAHAGWKGSVKNIYLKVIEAMQTQYGSQPENILVGISPSLGPQAAEFIHYRQELPEAFWTYQIAPNYFDFWAISQMQLVECGVQPANIEMARMCTYTNTEDCFSARRNRQAGRHGTVGCM